MADSLPTMSGANDSKAAVDDAERQAQGQSLASFGGASGASADTAAGDGVASEAIEKVEGELENKERKKSTGHAGPTSGTAATASGAAVAAESEISSEAAAAPTTTEAALQTPQVPPPVVTRNRTDSLSIEHHDDGLGSPGAGDGSLVCNITLLLPTGARHPYRIDERYLAKRSVEVPGVTESGQKDPFSISVYKLKELILREWREEWEGKPASPSSIRLIHFGKLLDDKEQLKKYHFSAEAPNVVHMSVRPPEMLEEDEAAKGKNGGREGRSRDGGSGCCVIL